MRHLIARTVSRIRPCASRVASKLIMVVDDERGLLTLIELMLARLGFDVVQAEDGQVALRLLESIQPDLFILDVMMPDINGFDLCRQLRRQPPTAETPIIFLSARSDEISIKLGFEAGANAYLSKMKLHAELPDKVCELLHLNIEELRRVAYR